MTHLVRSTPRRSFQVTASLALAATLLAACGAGEKTSDSSATSQAGGASSGSAPSAPASSDANAGIAKAKEQVATWAGPVTTYPDFTKLSKAVDLKGKNVTVVALGDQIPVIHGIGVGIQEAMKAAGATAKICDGKFNPTSVAACLKQAGDEKATAVVTLFVDYAMVPTAFDALAAKGTKVLVGGVAPTGGKVADGNLAFFDNTARVGALYEAMSTSAVAQGGADTKLLFVKLMDSSTTSGASDKGIAKAKELCPSCKVVSAEFTTPNIDKMPAAVSAALVANSDINAVIVPVDSFVPPALAGIQSAGFSKKVKLFSSSSDLAGLQRVKDNQQASDLGTPVLYSGWRFAHGLMQLLAGDKVDPETELITRDFTSANVGDVKLTPEAYLSPDWFGGRDYEAKLLTAWGLK